MPTPIETVQALYNLTTGILPIDRLPDVVDPDVVWIDAPLGLDLHGIDQVRAMLERSAPADPPAVQNVDCVEYHGDDQQGVVRWRWRAEPGVAALWGVPPGSATVDVDGLGRVAFRDGRLLRLEEYWDSADLLRRLGAEIPGPGRPA